MRITDYPDLLRTKGKEPMPQAWDETNQDWTPAIDSAATLKALREALGAPADATQADPVQEATAIALLKGLLELTAKRATETTLAQVLTKLSGDPATATKQDSVKAVLDAISQKDFATETTLAQVLTKLSGDPATATKQDSVKAVLDAISQKDFATETTLAQVLTKLSGDPATATKQDSVKAVLDAISTAVAARATEQTLEQIKTAMTDGTQKVALTGNFDTLRTPAVGRRTVTATAAELFAGASRLAGRRRLVIRNEDPVLRCLIGPATVSQQTGFPIEPGAVLEFPCDPEVAVPVYAISEGASLTVAVMEI